MSKVGSHRFCGHYECDPVNGWVIGKRGKPIGTLDTYGYLHISTQGREIGTVHRIIWEAMNGPIPDGMHINHINGIKTDNRLCNLEVVTPSENAFHAFRLGLRDAKGEKNGRSIGKRRLHQESSLWPR